MNIKYINPYNSKLTHTRSAFYSYFDILKLQLIFHDNSSSLNRFEYQFLHRFN